MATTEYSTASQIVGTTDVNGVTVKVMEMGGMYWPLTPCCDASDKGTEWGVACRNCYQEIDPALSASVPADMVRFAAGM